MFPEFPGSMECLMFWRHTFGQFEATFGLYVEFSCCGNSLKKFGTVRLAIQCLKGEMGMGQNHSKAMMPYSHVFGGMNSQTSKTLIANTFT